MTRGRKFLKDEIEVAVKGNADIEWLAIKNKAANAGDFENIVRKLSVAYVDVLTVMLPRVSLDCWLRMSQNLRKLIMPGEGTGNAF